ncbi:hypothetical protein BSKO_02715 [Bryopsis sp. KO-2023]|nr:hypothetical protein BSKO_02715 [Bryopsis sp. KO-2023]
MVPPPLPLVRTFPLQESHCDNIRCRRAGQAGFPSTLRLPRTAMGSYERDLIVCNAVEAVSDAEQEADDKRWEESGQKGDSNEWKWTLNWDEIMDNVIVGSCPRAPQDLERIAEEAGATAVLSLQCDLCLKALGIDWEAIRVRAVEKGVAMTRVPIRDFDHGDQTLMLPEAVRTLAMLLALNNRVYVHCTAGINRATLTVLGYMTFVQGRELHSALEFIKAKRPQAHPYVDCWKTTKSRLLQGRMDEVVAMARRLSSESNSKEGDSFGDWIEAENRLIQETFRRQLGCSVSLVSSLTELKAASVSAVCIKPQEMDRAEQEIAELKKDLEGERASLRAALFSLEHGNSLAGAQNKSATGEDSICLCFEDIIGIENERQGSISNTGAPEELKMLEWGEKNDPQIRYSR